VELSNPRKAAEFIDFAIKSLPTFHLRLDGPNIVFEKTMPEIVKIPERIKTCYDAVQWAEVANRPDETHLGSIAARDNLVCFSGNHAYFNGVSLIILADRFKRGDLREVTGLPIPVEEYLKDELAKPLDTQAHIESMSKLSTIPWTSHPAQEFPDDTRVGWICDSVFPGEMQCYNPRTAKFANLTDVLWRAGILAAIALRGDKEFSKWQFGAHTWVSMRPYAKGAELGNHIAPMTVLAERIAPGSTVKDLEEALRRDFKDKLKKKAWLNSLKASLSGIVVPMYPSARMDISNVGYFPTGELFK
jgi:hypothetical protein